MHPLITVILIIIVAVALGSWLHPLFFLLLLLLLIPLARVL